MRYRGQATARMLERDLWHELACPAQPAMEAGKGADINDECGFRDASIEGVKASLWVMRDRVERSAFPIMSAMPPIATTGCQIAIRRYWNGPAALLPRRQAKLAWGD